MIACFTLFGCEDLQQLDCSHEEDQVEGIKTRLSFSFHLKHPIFMVQGNSISTCEVLFNLGPKQWEFFVFVDFKEF